MKHSLDNTDNTIDNTINTTEKTKKKGQKGGKGKSRNGRAAMFVKLQQKKERDDEIRAKQLAATEGTVGGSAQAMLDMGFTVGDLLNDNRFAPLVCDEELCQEQVEKPDEPEVKSKADSVEPKRDRGRRAHHNNMPRALRNQIESFRLESWWRKRVQPVRLMRELRMKVAYPYLRNRSRALLQELRVVAKHREDRLVFYRALKEVGTSAPGDFASWYDRMQAPLAHIQKGRPIVQNTSGMPIVEDEGVPMALIHPEIVLKPKANLETVEEHLYQVTTSCEYLEYKGACYTQTHDQWYDRETGERLPENVIVANGDKIMVKGAKTSRYLASLSTVGKPAVLYSAYVTRKGVSHSGSYNWFKNFRVWLRSSASTLETVATFGQSEIWQRTLYTDRSTKTRRFIIHEPSLKTLRSKLVNKITAVNNSSLLKKLLEENPLVPQTVIIDTAIYFVEERALAQKQIEGITEACISFLEDKQAWVSPVNHTGKDLSQDSRKRAAMPEGTYPFTSIEECEKAYKDGQTCCAREQYTHADSFYDEYVEAIYPNYLYEPLNSREEKKAAARGVTIGKDGVVFRTQIDKEDLGYQTKGTHWATQAAVITHNSTKEYMKGLRRLIQGRGDDPLLRERGGRMAAHELNYLIGMMRSNSKNFDPRLELEKLTNSIKRVDKSYCGQGFNTAVCEELGLDLEGVTLNNTDKNLCAIMAAMKFTRAQEQLGGEGGRNVDAVNHLIEYIDELGAKVPERKNYVKAAVNYERTSQDYLDVQMKPHEPQKVKNGKLKFGRMVVSIVGQGWIEANPTAWYDNKHIRESPIRVDHHGDEFSVTLREVVRFFKYPYPEAGTLRKSFYGQAVITKTKLDGLAEVFTDMEQKCELEENLYCFCNHGDDQASVFRKENGEITWCEADLANNDSSHVDASFRSAYLVDRYRGEEVLDAYSQLAYPVKLVNPTCKGEYGFFRPTHGMRLPSGSVATTTLNTEKSEGVGLAHAFYGGSYEQAATNVGCEVTTKYGALEKISFLSKIFYKDGEGNIACALDLASIARKFGGIVGDALGSKKIPVWKRVVEHCQGVVAGHIGEPDTLFIKELRRKFSKSTGNGFFRERRFSQVKSKLKKKIRSIINPNHRKYTSDSLTELDLSILSHYYEEEELAQGIEEYLNCVNQLYDAPVYGATMYSKFVDRTMLVRYGLAPTVVD